MMSKENSVKEELKLENNDSDSSLDDINELIRRAETIIAENRARIRRSMPAETIKEQVNALLRGRIPSLEMNNSTTEEPVDEPVQQPPTNNSVCSEDDVIFVACEQIPVIDLSTPTTAANPQIQRRRRRRFQHDNPEVEIIDIPDNPSTSSSFFNNASISAPTEDITKRGGFNLNCPICIDTCNEPSSTLCGHVFCKKCILTAIKCTHKCPICKRKLNPKSVHPLYV